VLDEHSRCGRCRREVVRPPALRRHSFGRNPHLSVRWTNVPGSQTRPAQFPLLARSSCWVSSAEPSTDSVSIHPISPGSPGRKERGSRTACVRSTTSYRTRIRFSLIGCDGASSMKVSSSQGAPAATSIAGWASCARTVTRRRRPSEARTRAVPPH